MIHTLKARPTVRFDFIRPAGFRILSALDLATTVCGMNLEITSGTDGHAPPDPHCTGEAFDCSVKGLSDDQIVSLVTFLRSALGRSFTVLYEVPQLPSRGPLRSLAYVNAAATGAHIHIQRAKGTTYPPPVTVHA